MPIGIAAGIGAVGSIISGLIGSHAASSAASKQSAAIQQGINFQQGVYNQAQGNLQPFTNAGQSALPYLLGAYGLPGGNIGGTQAAFQAYTQTPAYQFALQQALLQGTRGLGSAGLNQSGAAGRTLADYAAGLAAQGWGQYVGGIGGIVGGGQSAAGALAGAGNTAAANIGGQYGTLGGTQASGIIGGANAWQNTLSNLVGNPNTNPYAIPGQGGQGGYIGQGINWLTGLFGGGPSSYTGVTTSTPGLIWNPANPVGTETLGGATMNPMLGGAPIA